MSEMADLEGQQRLRLGPFEGCEAPNRTGTEKFENRGICVLRPGGRWNLTSGAAEAAAVNAFYSVGS